MTLGKSNLIISVEEARAILGQSAENMSDEHITELISTLDLLAKDALELARKRDAIALGEVIYDCYQDEKSQQKELT
jgi:hypothetical protein